MERKGFSMIVQEKVHSPTPNECNYSSIVLAILLPISSIILVRDAHKPPPLYWKLPGGQADPVDDTHEDTAIRELEEETGAKTLKITQLYAEYIEGYKGAEGHTRYFFAVEAADSRLNEKGDGGQEVRLFTFSEFDEMLESDAFHPDHWELLQRRDVIEGLREFLK